VDCVQNWLTDLAVLDLLIANSLNTSVIYTLTPEKPGWFIGGLVTVEFAGELPTNGISPLLAGDLTDLSISYGGIQCEL
jgi:hypothetical protein